MKMLHGAGWFIGLALFQVLVLNRMHIGGYATPFFYIYFILKLDARTGRNTLMLWAFVLGLVVDMFGNTPGMNAASVTCLAFFRPSILRLVTLRDLDEGFRPGIKTMGFYPFLRYVLLSCCLFCTLLWTIDLFSFFRPLELLLKIGSSILSSLVCIICVEWMGEDRNGKKL